jgi:mRNA interferase MazF
MRRGDIAIVADRAGGDYAGKPRPAIIVQADVFDGTESVVVCPLTTRARDAQLLRVQVKPSTTLNLAQPSWIMVDKLTSMRRDRVTQVIGRPSDEELLALNRSLAVFLGFA